VDYTEQIAHAFQPIWRIEPPLLHGFEALARFANGASPLQVWALARERQCVRHLDEISIRCAIKEAFPLTGKLFVNVDGSWIGSGVTQLATLLTDDTLVYEVTEQASGGLTPLAKMREALDQRGVFLAVDDAGSEASTPDRLLVLRPRYVKLDKSVIDEWVRDPGAERFWLWIEMAHSVGAYPLAEGVENPEVVLRLRDAGVMYVQGFAFGRPLEASAWTPDALRRMSRTLQGPMVATG